MLFVSVRNHGFDRLWLKAVQPVKKIHEHFQCTLLSGLHLFSQVPLSFLHIWITFEPKVLLLERDGVIEEELRSIFESIWDCIPREVPMEGAQVIDEGSSSSQSIGEDGG